jgi:hypothetical protein
MRLPVSMLIVYGRRICQQLPLRKDYAVIGVARCALRAHRQVCHAIVTEQRTAACRLSETSCGHAALYALLQLYVCLQCHRLACILTASREHNELAPCMSQLRPQQILMAAILCQRTALSKSIRTDLLDFQHLAACVQFITMARVAHT